jgi:hypothetical protein
MTKQMISAIADDHLSIDIPKIDALNLVFRDCPSF